jgi:F0F1-type ATP synthase membrane subunit c/vacuolar-type H+-ATPase subunit K
MDMEAARMIGAGLAACGLGGVGIGMGFIFASMVKGIARNPGAKKDIMSTGIIGFALTESVALFAMLIAFLILFK